MTNIHDGGIPQPPAQEALHAERDDSPQAESQDEAPVSKKRKAGADLPGHVDKKAFTLRVCELYKLTWKITDEVIAIPSIHIRQTMHLEVIASPRTLEATSMLP